MAKSYYCSQLSTNVFFVYSLKGGLSVSIFDTNKKVKLIDVTVMYAFNNRAYIDNYNYPWLNTFLEKCEIAKPTYRCLILRGHTHEEFMFFYTNMVEDYLVNSNLYFDTNEYEKEEKKNRSSVQYSKGRTSKYYMKAVGVTFDDRQRVISMLTIGQQLQFVPEPTNPFDRYAVKIETIDGKQIGYISKDYNQQVFENITNSKATYKPIVSSITGGSIGAAYGVNIEVTMVEY